MVGTKQKELVARIFTVITASKNGDQLVKTAVEVESDLITAFSST